MKVTFIPMEPRPRVLMLFDEETLKYRIANTAFIHGEAARVNDNYGHDLLENVKEQAMHQWKDVCEEGNYDRVKDIIGLAVSEIEQLLQKYTYVPVLDHTTRTTFEDQCLEWVIEMMVPAGFSERNVDALFKLAQEYIVARVLEDWAAMTFPEAQPAWNARRTDIEERIRSAARVTGVHYRVRPSII